jgi:hypothetical protein
MSKVGKGLVELIVLGLLVAGAVGTMGVSAEATPGDVRASVNVPAAAQCGVNSGTALAVVSGGKVGFPKIKVLLVTSCVTTTPTVKVNLFFLDPATVDVSNNAAALVKTFATIFPASPPANSLPSFGWEALALRANKGDLLACGRNTAAGPAVLWSVDFSPFNNTNPPSNPPVPDGTATFLALGPAGSSCGGIAWDPIDKTIYQTASAVGANVFHFSTEPGATQPVPASIPSGCTTAISGLGIAGTSLFIACTEQVTPTVIAPTIRQVYKVNGALVRPPLLATASKPAGVPDDPTTFASEYKELLWTLDPVDRMFDAVEIPGGTVGQLTGAPVPFPGVGDPAVATSCQPTASGAYASTAGDALLDCWKTPWVDGLPGISYSGIYTYNNIANRDVVLCAGSTATPGDVAANCAVGTAQKDLLAEIDYMDFHLPDPVALAQVVAVFSPNVPLPLPPNGPGPVRLHLQLSDQIPHNNTTALVPCTPAGAAGDADFDVLKAQFFGTAAERTAVQNNTKPNALNAKALAFRYGMFVHNLAPAGSTTSGCSEIGGNDFVVSLGSWGIVNGHNVGTTDQQAGTLLHEFGHTLGLRHGGGDNVNCKPNYESVMSYTRQFSSPANRMLDYSREVKGVPLPVMNPVVPSVIGLDKANLDELDGVGGFSGKIAFGPVSSSLAKPAVADAAAGISWNKDLDATDLFINIVLDINQTTNASGGCPAGQGTDLTGTLPGTILLGFNDWANIQFNFRGSLDFSGGESLSDEMNLDTALALSRDRIDIKPNDRNNTIIASATQTVSVTIFSRLDDTVPTPQVELDAVTIDPSTLILRGTNGATWAISVKKNAIGRFQCGPKDRNKDGLVDFECDFQIPANTISVTETKAVLDGSTFDGQAVHSSDFIRVLP